MEVISLLVPFREDSTGTRTRTWRWLENYWFAHLPNAEVVIGAYDGTPYSKSAAVNEAASRAQGDIFVILDADAVVPPGTLEACAQAIRKSQKPLWYIPHTKLWRMTAKKSEELYARDPAAADIPLRLAVGEYEDVYQNAPGLTHMMSRRAFNRVGGMDPRFAGWGGEDGSFVRAVDTLYGRHARVVGPVMHFWHERPGAGSASTRTWDGQVKGSGRANSALIRAYRSAEGDARAMRVLVDEGLVATSVAGNTASPPMTPSPSTTGEVV